MFRRCQPGRLRQVTTMKMHGTTRRNLILSAGAAAAIAAASSARQESMAEAADGDNLKIGQVNSGTSITYLTSPLDNRALSIRNPSTSRRQTLWRPGSPPAPATSVIR
jgi:hypothetical protein